jgi:HD-GYP domain-containing protein (c-di-GMP phosphodiesterase class II)
MRDLPGFLRRLRLRHAVFLALLLAGIIPLAVSSVLLIWQNRDLIREQREMELLRSARSLSRELDVYLSDVRLSLEVLGNQLVGLAPSRGSWARQLRSQRLEDYLKQFQNRRPELIGLRLVDPAQSGGPRLFPPDTLSDLAFQRWQEALEETLRDRVVSYRFVAISGLGEPLAAIAVPIVDDQERLRLVVAGLANLQLLSELVHREVQTEVEAYLLDAEEGLLWSDGTTSETAGAFLRSGRNRQLASIPVHMIISETSPEGVPMSVTVSRIEETGWTVLVRRPAALAFEVVNKMVFNTVVSSVILLLLALLLSLLAARKVSQPIQKLAQTSHEMADGNFGHRVETSGLVFELADLGDDFNRMSAHVERYIEELKRAAQANRDLFIGSLRAFVAAIDAKDPYTRGHSERVAKVARTVARYLGQSEAQQERIWISALLHDVGKIGIEDRVLQKVGRLTEEEYSQMKMHPAIGAEIIGPIQQLEHAKPVIRWHHENWNGRGYPDGLKGEEIPLDARIVAVADTFDAVTTNRPYQQAFTLEFAVETITKLTGQRFDAKVTTAFLNAYENGEITIAGRSSEGRRMRSENEVEKRVLSMT